MSTESAEDSIERGIVMRTRIRLAGFCGAAVLCAAAFIVSDEHMPFADTLLPALFLAGLPGGIFGLLIAEIGRCFVPGQWRLRRALAARRPPATWLTRAGTVCKYGLLLGVPLLLLAIVVPVHHDKNLQARIAYARNETRPLRAAVEDYYARHRQLPPDAKALGSIGQRSDYPDGGYFQLLARGQIRITFTVKPELTRGSLLLTPTVKDSQLQWTCTSEGDIAPKILGACRQ